jgi:hypothetical protein
MTVDSRGKEQHATNLGDVKKKKFKGKYVSLHVTKN